MAIYDELEELTGRLVALSVNYQGIGDALQESIELYQHTLKAPNPQIIQLVTQDLLDLQIFLHKVYEKFDDLRKELKPILELIKGLLEPAK